MVLFLLLLSARAQYIVKHFGEFQLPLNDSQTFDLLEYFSGNFLDYSIECSPKDSAGFEITKSEMPSTTMNSKNPFLSFNEMIPRYRMHSYWKNSNHFSVYFSSAKVFVIKASFDIFKAELFQIIDFGEIESFNILGLSLVKINEFHMLFVFGWSEKLEKNLFFNVNINTFDFISVSIPELEKIKDLRIDTNIKSKFLCLNGTNEQQATLFILEFFNIFQPPVLLFKITEFLTIPRYKSMKVSVTTYYLVNPSDTFKEIVLVVIDQMKNFIFFTLNSEGYIEHYSLPLGLYGDPSDIQLVVDVNSGIQCFLILTSKGALTIDYENRSIIGLWPFPKTVNQVIAVYFDFEFMHFFHIVDNFTLAITVSSIFDQSNALYVHSLQFKSINIEGPWCFFEFLENVIFLHLDYSDMNLVSIKTLNPLLKVWLNNDSVECKVTATDQTNMNNKTDSVKMIDLNSSVFDISNIYQGREYTQKLKFSIQVSKSITVKNLPIFMITGWNVSCNFQQVTIPNFRISDETLQKVTKMYSFKFRDCLNVFVENGFLICVYQNSIFIANVTEEDGYSFDIDNVEQVHVSVINETANIFALLCKSQEKFSLKVLIVNLYNYNQSFQDYEVKKELEGVITLKSFKSFIFLYNEKIILMLSLDYKSMKFQYFYQINSYHNDLIKNISIFEIPNFEYLLNIYTIYSDIIVISTIDTLSSESSSITSNLKKNISRCLQVVTSTEEVYLLLPEKIMVYDYMLTESIREINIDLEEVLILNSFLVGKNSDSFLFVINGTECFRIESVYYLEKNTDQLIGFTLDPNNNTIVVLQSPEKISFYTLQCPSFNDECGKYLKMNIELINEEKIINTTQNAQLNLQCSNFYFSQNFSYSLKIDLLGLNVDMDYINPILKYNYDDSDYFNLSEKFGGFDLSYSVDFPDNNFNSTEVKPVSVVNSISLVSSINLSVKITGFTLIKNSSFVAVTTSNNSVSILDLFDKNRSRLNYYPFENNLTCPLVQYVAAKSGMLLFVGVCFNYTEHIIQKYFIRVTIIDASMTKEIHLDYIPLNYSYNILRVIPASETLFLLALVEVQSKTFNNNIELFKGSWNTEVKIEYFELINFFTLNLDFTCFTSIEGEYFYTGSITLYLVDQLYGVRIVKYINNTFELIEGIPVSCNFTSMALCGHQLYVGCLDTSIFLYKRSNGKFSFLSSFYPYNNDDPFHAMTGYMDCNHYYHSNYIIMPIARIQGFSIRVLNTFNSLDSQILKDVEISNNAPPEDHSTKAKFFNNSVFVTFDSFYNVLMVFRINQPCIVIPKLSKEQYEEILKETNGKPVGFNLNVYNKLTSNVSVSFILDRGKIESSSDYHDFKVPVYAFILGALGILIFMASCTLIGYKVFKMSEKKKEASLIEIKSVGVSCVFSNLSIN